MTERPNRRDQIVAAAAALFLAHGYHQTSVRQIAGEVGCTEAALYYHFPQGKRSLFEAVLESNVPDFLAVLVPARSADSLGELIRRLGDGMAQQRTRLLPRMRRMAVDFHQLDAEQQALLKAQVVHFHATLVDMVARFLPDRAAAGRTAWLLICAGQGYAQFFWNLELDATVDYPSAAFYTDLAAAIDGDAT